jgi:hypothetical protein
MSTDPENQRRLSAEDRAALRTELAAEKAGDERLEVFDALAKQADEAEDDAPAMPDALREKLVEKFGETESKPAPQPSRSTPAASPGFFAQLSEFFAQKQVVYGSLAVAACALLFTVVLQNTGRDDGGKIDTVRGGGQAVSADKVAIYLYPEAESASFLAMMDPDQKPVVCVDAADLAERVSQDKAPLAVAVNLEGRKLSTYRGGALGSEIPVGGETEMDLLLALRTAVDVMTGRVE